MSLDDIAAANICLPNMVGFVLAPGRRRTVSVALARQMRARLHPAVTPVGVFVDPDPDEVLALLRQNIIAAAQLHGEESEETVAYLQRRGGRPVLRAFQVRGEEDLARAAASRADLVLLDAGQGSGARIPTELLRGFARPYILAGGLTPDNVAGAIAELRPFGVDVSSGIEEGGRKSPEKMAAFTRAVRARGPRDAPASV